MEPRYQIDAENVFAKRVKEEVVLLDLRSGFYFTLNQVGADIWALLEQQVSVAEMVETLKISYEVDDAQLKSDVESLLAELLSERLIIDTNQ